jgi:hypothetical protein
MEQAVTPRSTSETTRRPTTVVSVDRIDLES